MQVSGWMRQDVVELLREFWLMQTVSSWLCKDEK